MTKAVDIQPDPFNANRGTPRGEALLEKSFERNGAGRSALADADGVLIAGNKSYETAMRLGFTPKVIDIDPSEFVILRRPDLDLDSPDDLRARELSVADNRTAQLNIDLAADVIAAYEAAGVSVGEYYFPEELLNERAIHARKTAGDFLNPFLDDEDGTSGASPAPSGGAGPSPSSSPGSGAGNSPGDAPVFQMSFVFTTEQRVDVLAAINQAKAEHGFTSSMDALVAICRTYLR